MITVAGLTLLTAYKRIGQRGSGGRRFQPPIEGFQSLDCSRPRAGPRLGSATGHAANGRRAVEWTQRSIATSAGHWLPYVDLAAAGGWLGRETEAWGAIEGLHKLMPGFTVQDFANMKRSGNLKFQREYAHRRRPAQGGRPDG